MRFALAALLLGCACLWGCGGDSEDPTAAPPSAPSSQSQSAEASIEGFGKEAEGSERAELLAIFHGYLDALAGEEHEQVCAYVSQLVRKTLFEQFTRPGQGSRECPQTVERLLSPEAAAIAKEQEQGQIHKVRTDGESAFVVFKAPGARLYQLNLIREGEEWKLSILLPPVLAPTLPEEEQGGKS